MTKRARSIFLLGFAWLFALSFSEAKEPSTSAEKGPVRLTLTLYSATIRIGEPLWFRLTMTNLGHKPMKVTDGVFCSDADEFMEAQRLHASIKEGIFLVVLGPDGKPIQSDFPMAPFEGCSNDRCGGPNSTMDDVMDCEFKKVQIDPKEQEKVQGMIDGWKKQGLNENQIQAKLDAYSQESAMRAPLKFACPAFRLPPSRSVESPSWVFKGFCRGDRTNPPQPPGHFAEAVQFQFDKPGRYKIYAGYNYVPDAHIEQFYKKHDWKREHTAFDVKFKTPALDLEVLP